MAVVGALSFSALAAAAPSADLVINQAHYPDPVSAGGVVTYTITVDNNGPDRASKVNVQDLLPPGSQFVSVTPSSGSCATNESVTGFSCALGDLAFQGRSTIELKVRLPSVGVWLNKAQVTSTTNDPNQDNNQNDRHATVVDAVDLGLEAISSLGDGVVEAGTPFHYTLKVTNHGPSDLPEGNQPKVEFGVPAGTTITGNPGGNGWNCSLPSGVNYPVTNPPFTEKIQCTRDDTLPIGESYPDITVNAVPNKTGTVSAGFSVSSSYPDGELQNNTVPVDVKVDGDGSDLQINKSASPSGTVAINTDVTYTLKPRFNGGVSPRDMVITDQLPAGLTLKDIKPEAPWNCAASSLDSGLISCKYTGEYVGGNFTDLPLIRYTATVKNAASMPNTAHIAGGGTGRDPVPDNNSSTVTITGDNRADLQIRKTPDFTPVVVGQDYNYRITVRNDGPVDVQPGQLITMTENIPAGMTLRGKPTFGSQNGIAPWVCEDPAGGYPAAGPFTLKCTMTGKVPAHWNLSDIVLPVKNTVGGKVVNTASVELGIGDSIEGNPGNNGVSSDTSGSIIGQEADLSITKDAPKSVVVGENLVYTLVATNAGPAAATNVRVKDQLNNLLNPNGLVSAVASSGSCQPAGPANGNVQVDCNIGTLAAGQSATVTITVKPNNNQAGVLKRENQATVFSDDVGDPDRDNNTSNKTVTDIEPRVDMTVAKAVSPATVPVGQPMQFTITAINKGPSTATNVVTTDEMPANTEFVKLVSVSDGGKCEVPEAKATKGTITCTWPNVGNNAQRTAVYRLLPLKGALETADKKIVNVVNVTTDSIETDKTNNSATAEAKVIDAKLDILVTKTDSIDPLPLGSETEYTVTIKNAGPSYGTNLVMTDTFPGTTPSAVFSYQGGLTLSDPEGQCTEPAVGDTTGTIVCTFPRIEPGEGKAILVKYKMRAESIVQTGAYSGTQSNTVTVKVDEPETQMANNETQEDTTTRRDAVATDLALTKTVDKQEMLPGQEAIYTLTVQNLGPLDSKGAQVTDPLPAGLSFVSSADGCVFNAGTVSCGVGELKNGDTKAFTFTVKLDESFPRPGTITNVATLDAPGDTNPDNDEGKTTTEVPPDESEPPVDPEPNPDPGSGGNSGSGGPGSGEDPNPEPEPEPDPKPPVQATPVPVMGAWSMGMMLVAVAGLGGTQLRRRKKSTK